MLPPTQKSLLWQDNLWRRFVLPAVFPPRAQGLGTGDHGPPQKQRLLQHKDAPRPQGQGLAWTGAGPSEVGGAPGLVVVSNMDTHLDRVHQAPSLHRIAGDLASPVLLLPSEIPEALGS